MRSGVWILAGVEKQFRTRENLGCRGSGTSPCTVRRLFKMAVQRGRSKRSGDAYSLLYVELLSDARTKLADFLNSLLGYME